MVDEQPDDLDRELAELGAQWRAETPVDFTPREIRRTSFPPTGWVLTAAAAVLVIGAVIGTLVLSPGGKDGPAASPTPALNGVSRLDCGGVAPGTVSGAPAVPRGALAARLCGRTAGSDFEQAWPVDTLNAADAGRVVDAINDLRAWTSSDGAIRCPPSPTGPFRLVLLYPDGVRVSVRGSAGCGQPLRVVGGAKFAGAAGIGDLALRLIKHERQTRTTLAHPNAPLCPASWKNVAGTIGAAAVDPGDDVAVTACQYRLAEPTDTADGRLDWQVVVNNPASLLASATSGRTSTTYAACGAYRDPALVQRVLLVRDRFGDITVVSTNGCISNLLAGSPHFPSLAFADEVRRLFPVRLQQ